MKDQRFPLLLLLFLTLFLLKGCSQEKGNSGNPAAPEPGVFEEGIASWYGEEFQGKRTAGGEVFDMNQLTAAHKTLQFGTIVEVTAKKTGRRVKVKINDRGPYVKDRIIDLSKRAALDLGIVEAGTGEVSLRIAQEG